MKQTFDFYHDDIHYIVMTHFCVNNFNEEPETVIHIVRMTNNDTGTLVYRSHAVGHPNAREFAQKAFNRYIEYVSMTPEQKTERRKKSDELKAAVKERIKHG